MPINLKAYIEEIRRQLRDHEHQSMPAPTLECPDDIPGRRRLQWHESTFPPASPAMTVDEMRDELVRVVSNHLYASDESAIILRVDAGGGKTYSGIDIAQKFARDGARILWAAPRHDLWNELALNNENFDPSLWFHWHAMDAEYRDGERYCRYSDAQRVWMQRGYRSFDLCRQLCQQDNHISVCPYREQAKAKQPIIFGMHQHLACGLGIRKPFDIAIVDELPMQAFQDKRYIPLEYLAVNKPGPVDDLANKIRNIAGLKPMLQGKVLFDRIGEHVGDVFAQVEIDDDAIPLPPTIYDVNQVQNVPWFWLPRFLLIAEQEWQCWRRDWPAWVHRIQLMPSHLVLLWRRYKWDKLPRKIVALDATGEPRMYYDSLFCEPPERELIDPAPEPTYKPLMF